MDRGMVMLEDDDTNINITDVIEVISKNDPSFKPPEPEPTMATPQNPKGPYPKAHVVIVEQPASKAMRFRYECEGRSAGSIPGQNSTPENKTYPTIKVIGYEGKAVVVVSCVTKDDIQGVYRPHPHNLVGKEGCRRGVCTVEIPSDTMTVSFSNLGIRCVKKKDIEQALKEREEIRVDPFSYNKVIKQGVIKSSSSSSIDLNAVRLCFQVFLELGGKFQVPLPPIVSEPIYDKKAMSDLQIFQLSSEMSSVAGGQKILLFCEKVTKDDIAVRFFEEKDGKLVWEGFADFQPSDVHRQVGIAFTTPRYATLEVKDAVNANIQLYRPSDKATSDPLRFVFTPLEQEGDSKRKRVRVGSDSPKTWTKVQHMQDIATKSSSPSFGGIINLPESSIKVEPREIQNKMFGGSLSPYSPVNLEAPMQYRVPPLSVSPASYSQMEFTENYNYSPNPPMKTFQSPEQSLDGMTNPQQWNVEIKWDPNLNINSNQFQEQNWNTFNITPAVPVPMDGMNNLDDPGPLGSVLNLDSGDLQQLNSTDLANNLSVFECPEEGISNLNISNVDNEVQNNGDNNNMTDSLTRIANSAINEICNLNQMSDVKK